MMKSPEQFMRSDQPPVPADPKTLKSDKSSDEDSLGGEGEYSSGDQLSRSHLQSRLRCLPSQTLFSIFASHLCFWHMLCESESLDSILRCGSRLSRSKRRLSSDSLSLESESL